MKKKLVARLMSGVTVIGLLMFALAPAQGRTRKQRKKKKADVVYVCACLGTRSCSCMSEAKMEGPCACGTQGGPPMKAVPAKGAWAKQNRQELAK